MEETLLSKIIQWFATTGITIVAIGWTVEKLLRLIDKVTPERWQWDDNLADILARVLKVIAKVVPVKKTQPPTNA